MDYSLIDKKKAEINDIILKIEKMGKIKIYLDYNLPSSVLFWIAFFMGPLLLTVYAIILIIFVPKIIKTFRFVGWNKQIFYIRFFVFIPAIVLFLFAILIGYLKSSIFLVLVPFPIYFFFLRSSVDEWIREKLFYKSTLEQNLNMEISNIELLDSLNKQVTVKE